MTIEDYFAKGDPFLKELMKSSREGHLCYWSEKEYPERDGVKRDGNRYYLEKHWRYETVVLEHVKRLCAQKMEKISAELENVLPAQKEAIEHVLENAFTVICGGPGTGKSYTACQLVKAMSKAKKNLRVIVSAPTGKAASHLQANLPGVEAYTLHRLLRIQPGRSKLFSGRKIDADLLIVDEASMIDVPLLAQLLEAVGSSTRLVLMGDPDQLPPVEAGSLFAEMAALFGKRLTQSMRAQNMALHALREAVAQGALCFQPGQKLDWKFDASIYEKIYQKIRDEDVRVLGALRQGPFGTDEINRRILALMNREERDVWEVPIMVTGNVPDLNLYNGTCGVLKGKGRLELSRGMAYFPEEIAYGDLPPFDVAFCLSIHKSQGSEYNRVLALFPEGSENFGKEALYTAVTRARNSVEVVGEEEVLRKMLMQQSRRTSGFTSRLGQPCAPLCERLSEA